MNDENDQAATGPEPGPSAGIAPAPRQRRRAELILGCSHIEPMWGTSKTITPEIARLLLDLMPPQRPVRRLGVERLAKEMCEGKFVLTHQGVAFDEDGLLVDGQHRLLAIVRSGVTVTMMVNFNVPRASFRAIDRHTPRNASDDFVILGLVDDAKTGNTLGAAARIVSRIDRGVHPANDREGANSEVLERVVRDHALLRDTVEWCMAHRGTVMFPLAPFSAFLCLFREVDDEAAMRFAEQAVGGGGSRGDPAFMLRESQIGENTRRKKGREAFMFRIVRAWNALREGRRLTKLIGTPRFDSGFPMIHGYRAPGAPRPVRAAVRGSSVAVPAGEVAH